MLRSPLHRDQAGFTMIELLVVMVIIGILIALGAKTLNSTRITAQKRAAVSVARMYRDAVEDFQLEHSGRAPNIGGADWSSNASLAAAPNLQSGPIRRLGKKTVNNYYMNMIPEPVRDGSIRFSNVPGVGSATGANIVYSSPGNSYFELRIYVRQQYYCTETNRDTVPAGMIICK